MEEKHPVSEPKQVILVRTDLNMPVGKIAAQVAHASMGALLKGSYNIVPVETDDAIDDELVRCIPMDPPTNLWLDGSFVKVCLAIDSLEDLLEIEAIAERSGIRCCRITDSGRTVFNQQPTVTCLAIGPDYSDVINKITGHLRLLK